MVYTHSLFFALFLATHVLHGAFDPGLPVLIKSCLLTVDSCAVLAVFFVPKLLSATNNTMRRQRSSITLPSGLVISGLDINPSYIRKLDRSVSAPTLPKDCHDDRCVAHPLPYEEYPCAVDHNNGSSTFFPCSSGRDSVGYGDSLVIDNSTFGERDGLCSPRDCGYLPSSHSDNGALPTPSSEGGNELVCNPGDTLFDRNVVPTRRFSV